MFSTFYIVFIVLYAILCSVEFIVFNEEILLALCFFSFVFFSYNSFSESLFSSLTARATKFEIDFLTSFSIKKKALIANFDTCFETRGFQQKFQIMLNSILTFLTLADKNLMIKQTNSIYSTCFSKFSELSLINNKLLDNFQKNCINHILYPLIFKSTNTSMMLTAKTQSTGFKTNILKTLSII